MSRKMRILQVILAVVLALVLIGTAAAVYALDPYGLRMAPGVSIGGLEVGGMLPWEARKALSSALEETLLTKVLTVELPEETLTVSSEEAGLKVSVGKAIRTAFRYGRKEGAEAQIGLSPYLKVEEGNIREKLEAYAGTYDTVLTQPAWELTGTAPALGTDVWQEGAPLQTLVLTVGTPECHLDVDGIYGQILALYDQGISAVRAGQYRLTPEVEPSALPKEPDLESIYAASKTDAVDDSLDMETYQPVSGSYGCHFDLEQALALAAAAEPGQRLELPMVCFPPEILGEGVYFRDELGVCETRHTDNENRNTNLRLLCQTLDGYIIQPGQAFSYNEVLGERTPEKGYKPAPAYSGNRLIQDYGGGVCQGSTTLYNCLLLADMEITERHCHGARVGYVPLGLDAAVNWATKTDLSFVNNSHFPVMIRAEVSDGYVKMKLLGTDEKDYYIKMESGGGEDDVAIYAASYKCKYDKKTNEQISRELEARSTYYKDLG